MITPNHDPAFPHAPPPQRHLPLIIGTGNTLLHDDAAGPHVIRLLEEEPPPHVNLLDAGTDVVRAMPWIERTPRLLLVCALKQGRSAGSLCMLDGYDLPRTIRAPVSQELTVPDLIEVLTPDARPHIFCVLAIEPLVTNRGIGLSPVVETSLPGAVDAVRRVIRHWQDADAWLSDASLP
jgi:hydrogenase maturation protease